jgi:beta-glucuronidase
MICDDNRNGRIDAPYDSWVDKNRNNLQDADEPTVGDFQLLSEMGVNTIRIYHHSSVSPEIKALYPAGSEGDLMFNHAPNKALLRDLFSRFGIRVAMGDELGAYAVASGVPWDPGTDYLDATQKANMRKSVEDMIREFKDEPYILCWVLGNENNYRFTHTNAYQHPKEYAQFVNEMAKLIHSLDPHHPVVLANGETELLSAYAAQTPDIDIFGVNSYRNPGFGSLWQQVASAYGKPVLLTEFGIAIPKIVNGKIDEADQAARLRHDWCDIEAHVAGQSAPQNALGGFIYSWLDNWWQDGDPNALYLEPGHWNHETMGLASQGDGSFSPYLRQLRKSYFTIQALWKSKTDSCAPSH